MFRACVIPLFICLATVSPQERGPVQSPQAQPPIFSSRAELVVAHVTTFDQVLKQAQASNAAIYTVGIIDPLERDANPRLPKRLALATGGESFFPSDVNDVDEVFQRIADDIRHSYTLGYVSSNPARDGRFRRIRIVATDSARRSLRVRTRDGYRAGGPVLGS